MTTANTLTPKNDSPIRSMRMRATHTAAVMAACGAVLDQRTVSADPAGCRALLAFAWRYPGRRAWVVEGTGGYGVGLCRLLVDAGEGVVEVDRPDRPARRGGTTSNAIDAARAARDALTRTHQSSPGGEREAIRLLLTLAQRRRRSCKRHSFSLLCRGTAWRASGDGQGVEKRGDGRPEKRRRATRATRERAPPPSCSPCPRDGRGAGRAWVLLAVRRHCHPL